ncbi:MAG: hypothetical protein UX21_C0020G0014 [Microgenomates group bacterium GW2011_GWC2_45_8]|nr:MAG: hypothetical protein UX21_C0020G0014 [Microgenomates group bacterium GW2011_GWC2_45_8]KKU25502.1 MAG: hypothetical protein UX37_C0020G0002 [Microgenomates group bacterium GW2011_GWA2_46_16]
MESNLKQRFYSTYNKIPLGVRDEPILVIEDDSISWRIARIEIDTETQLSKIILKKLDALKLI